MTTSPERCLGALIKDIDEDISPNEIDFTSKDETTCRTSSELKLSLDSIYSFNSNSSFFSPLLKTINFLSRTIIQIYLLLNLAFYLHLIVKELQ